ncbi:MAG: CDP-diacylglycerol--serine O-phosphatidyltransferase [Pseudoalteromonas tetraodonis]|jgi:CDP-diacylglycerol--serine O-phosphatidyltransferase
MSANQQEENIHELSQPQKRRRGIYLLPNLFTTAALFAAFYSMIAATNGDFGNACAAVFISMILDGADGRVARMTNTESDFGKEYDSLSDMVAFGVAPAMIMYHFALADLKGEGWIWFEIGGLAAFFYCAAAALRLARFNSMVGTDREDKRFFVGLPSPSGAALVIGLVWTAYSYDVSGKGFAIFAMFVTALSGVLMVSNVRFHSFKDVNMSRRVSFFFLVMVVGSFVLVAIRPPEALLAIVSVYVASGLVGLFGGKKLDQETAEEP